MAADVAIGVGTEDFFIAGFSIVDFSTVGTFAVGLSAVSFSTLSSGYIYLSLKLLSSTSLSLIYFLGALGGVNRVTSCEVCLCTIGALTDWLFCDTHPERSANVSREIPVVFIYIPNVFIRVL